MRAKLALPLTGLILVLLVVAGCGHSGKQQAGAARCMIPGAPAVTVNVISYPSPGMPFFGDRMASCTSPAGLTVHHQMLPYEELVNKAAIAMSGSSPAPYNIIHVFDQLLIEWAGHGWLAPLDDLVRKYRTTYALDEIPESVWDLMKYDGKIYAIPAIHDVEILYYRKDVLDQLGLPVPRTQQDLLKTCLTMKEHKLAEYPLSLMYSRSSHHFSYEFHDLLHSLGGHWLNADGSAAFNSAAGIQALDTMTRIYRTCLNPNTLATTVEDAVIGYQQGQFLIGVLWLNEAPQLDDPAASRFAGKFGFAPAPAACAGCPPAGYWAQDSWVIPAHSTVDPDTAFRVAMEGVTTAAQRDASGQTLVVRDKVANVDALPYWRAGVDSIKAGVVGIERNPEVFIAREQLERFGVEALLGNLSPKEALDRAAAEYARLRVAH